MGLGSSHPSGAFCTYFDHWYLPRALALAESLQRHRPGARLWALCLTELCYEVLKRLAPTGVEPLPLADLEHADPDLRSVREHRSVTEYYFTCTPALVRHVLQRDPDADSITYLDADLFFFSDPEPLFEELGPGSIGIIAHRFPPRLRELQRHGVFNVGWVTFRRDDRGEACLRSWREQCLEWCHDRLEPDRYAEQKYLDAWPTRFDGVVVLNHPGANLAPWNIDTHRVTFDGSAVCVDQRPLLFYHAHGLRHGVGADWEPGLDAYGVPLSDVLARHVYEPYLRALDRQRSAVDGVLDAVRQGNVAFGDRATCELGDYDRAWPEREVARLARRATIDSLSASELDRAARLAQIERIGAQLAESDADRAARLAEIQRIGAQLAESDADRAARLAAINELSVRLADSEADRAARLEQIERLGRELAVADSDRVSRLEQMERLHQELQQTQALYDRAAAGLAEAQSRQAAAEDALSQAQSEIAALASEVERLRRDVSLIQADAQRARTELHAAHNSISWRLTASLRALTGRGGRRAERSER